MGYGIYVVDGSDSGSLVATLSDGSGTDAYAAQVQSMTWRMNDHDQAVIFIPRLNPSISSVTLMSVESEIRIEKDGVTVFWGVPTSSNLGADGLSVRVKGLTFYFTKRFIGDHQRNNLVTNGDFETVASGVPTGWTVNGSGISRSADTTHYKRGGYSLEINSSTRVVDTRSNGDSIDSPVDPTNYHGVDAQIIQLVNPGFVGDFYFTVVARAWYYIRDDGSTAFYKGKPFDGRGFYVQTQTAAGAWTGNHWFTTISDSDERNVWKRVEFQIIVYGGERIQIRLYAPAGDTGQPSAIHWDTVGLFLEESLSFYGSDGTGIDIKDIAEGIIEHVQGLTPEGNPAATKKDDLGIRGDPSNGSIGEKLAVAYQHADHENAWDALNALSQMENGIDFRVSWNAGKTARYIKFDRPLGSAKSAFNLQVSGASSNIIDMEYVVDGEPVANSVLMLGDGSGPDREESTYIDTAGLGMYWESVIRAPQGYEIDLLDELAFGELQKTKVPKDSLTVSLTDADFGSAIAGNLLPGDTVDVSGTWGNVTWTSKTFKLVRLTLDPGSGVYTAEFNTED